MNLDEFLYRIRRQASLVVMWIKQCTGYGLPFNKRINPQNHAFCRSKLPCLPQLPWFYEDLTLSDFITENDPQTCIIPNQANLTLTVSADDLCWHTAPDTGRSWPLKFFARIPFAPGNPTGDIQLAWARSRLQNLIILGLISNLTDDLRIKRQAAQCMEKIMLSWIDANPWLKGVNYISTMECALRLISACHAFDQIRNEKINPQAWQGLVYLVHSHAYFIRRRLCLYSYAGNHTLGECAGLVYAALLFPELPDAEEWLVVGLTIMEQEANIQILPDGGNREQSFQYLALIVDLCGLVTCLLRHYGKSPPDGIERAWMRGKDYLQAFALSPDNLPAIGDSDDGYALAPYLRLSWKDSFHASELPAGPLQIFAASGYSKIPGAANHGTMRFSHGKLGLASTFGHGHADALSVCWDLDGKPILVDPGTYQYHVNARLRRYFRGTSAHNTIVVDDNDQALQDEKTAFGWSSAYTAKLIWHSENLDGNTVLLANHDGYSASGVIHWRALIYDDQSGRWMIWDRIDGMGEHVLALHWHVDAPVEMTDDGIILNCMNSSWFVSVKGGKSCLYRGNEQLPLGWISRKYGTKEPLNTLKTEIRTCLPHEFLTIITPMQGNLTQPPIDDNLIDKLRNKCSES
ncbi:MAG: heparinase II/III family protein [Nitrosomonas sp.]|nr:heparinase II/III family protein [Nitrosomonas sp.]